MKKLMAGFLVVLTTFSVTPAMATTGADLTSQAEHILWQILESEGVQNKDHKEVQCLAENIYFEARAESFSGKAAVGNVTRNRVLDSRWPNTYCSVVTQGPVRESWKTKQHKDLADSERVYYPKKHRCQFSWYCDGKSDYIQVVYEKGKAKGKQIGPNMEAWKQSVQVSLLALKGVTIDPTSGATHYYNHNISNPNWGQVYPVVAILSNHTFLIRND